MDYLIFIHILLPLKCNWGVKKKEERKKRSKEKSNWVNYHLCNCGLAFCKVSVAHSTSEKLFNSMIHIKAPRTPAAKLKGQTAHLPSDVAY